MEIVDRTEKLSKNISIYRYFESNTEFNNLQTRENLKILFLITNFYRSEYFINIHYYLSYNLSMVKKLKTNFVKSFPFVLHTFKSYNLFFKNSVLNRV